MAFNINYYIQPPRFKRIASLGDKSFNMLDVGCANGSVALAKRWFPKCRYHGLDITDGYLTDADRAAMEQFYKCDLETSDLSELPDQKFDVIVIAHVIEHLTNSLQVLARLTKKLAPGGHIYVEFPSVNALSLPSARGTLNFCDDPTHIRLYDVKEVANVFLANGLKVIRGGRRREWLRILLSPLTLPTQIKTLLTEGRLDATGLWDLMGFAEFVYARRIESSATG